MQAPNQSQTTSQTHVRDAAVQISDENPYEKADAILEGAMKEIRTQNPLDDDYTIAYSAAYKLAIILQNLTSPNRNERERSKSKIRDLVKAGMEATK